VFQVKAAAYSKATSERKKKLLGHFESFQYVQHKLMRSERDQRRHFNTILRTTGSVEGLNGSLTGSDLTFLKDNLGCRMQSGLERSWTAHSSPCWVVWVGARDTPVSAGKEEVGMKT
jgi:hypothetical protein